MRIPYHAWLFALLTILAFSGSSAVSPPQGVPTLDDMAGEWIPMRDVANPPAVHNFHDMLLVNRDLTSFACKPDAQLYARKKHSDYPAVTLTLNGKEYPATECRWYPYKVLRRNNDCGGLAVESDTRMINEQRAVLVRTRITNPEANPITVTLSLSVAGALEPGGQTVVNIPERTPGFQTFVRVVQKVDTTTSDQGTVRWQWNVTVPAGGEKMLEFVAGDGRENDTDKTRESVTHWSENFSKEFEDFRNTWEERWSDTFTHGNKHFSGNLPVLETDNAALRRNYYMGAVTMLILERTQFRVHPRSFITSGERGPGTQYYWDASMASVAWALLEPAGMKATLRRWLVQSMRRGAYTMLGITKGFDANEYDRINGYAFNACTIFKGAYDYLRVTGDLAFLDEKLENGKTVLERMDEISTDWKTLVPPGSQLANYGENKNLLECAPAYIHRVASANAQNVLMMRQVAELHALRNRPDRAQQLRAEADGFTPAVLDLYKPVDGVWHSLHLDGKRVELRHCVDYIYVGDALAHDLTPPMRREMTEFVKRELFMRDWMRAMSLKDEAAAVSDRPDHGPMGAYDGWIPLTAGTMWRLGFPNDAFEFYCRTATVTKEGPFAQAREFYGPHRMDHDAPVRIAERRGCMKECISGAAFTDVVITAFFGFDPSLDGARLLADPETPRPFTGKLLNVCSRGRLINISAGKHGVSLDNK